MPAKATVFKLPLGVWDQLSNPYAVIAYSRVRLAARNPQYARHSVFYRVELGVVKSRCFQSKM